jgi:hypothetical protein
LFREEDPAMTDMPPRTDDTVTPVEPYHGEVIPEDQAKQGRRGLHMMGVLGVSLILVLLAFGGLYVFRSHPNTDTTPAAAAQRAATVARTSS